MWKMARQNSVDGLNILEDGPIRSNCVGCAAGKMSRTPFPHSVHNENGDLLSLVHFDLAGPIKPLSHGGKQYILTFIDDKSRMSWIYLLKNKSEVFD